MCERLYVSEKYGCSAKSVDLGSHLGSISNLNTWGKIVSVNSSHTSD